MRYQVFSYSLPGKSGLKIPGPYFVSIKAQGDSLNLICTRPASQRSRYRDDSNQFQVNSKYNYVIRSVGIVKDKTVDNLLADNDDPLVKKMFQANKLTDNKNYREAAKLYKGVIQAMARNKYRYQQWLAPTVTAFGVLSYRAKDFRSAVYAFNIGLQMAEFAKAERQQALLQQNLGESYFQLKDFQKAEQHLSKAHDLKEKIAIEQPLMTESIIWLGKTYQMKGEKEKAEQYLKRGLAIAKKTNDKDNIRLAEQALKSK